ACREAPSTATPNTAGSLRIATHSTFRPRRKTLRFLSGPPALPSSGLSCGMRPPVVSRRSVGSSVAPAAVYARKSTCHPGRGRHVLDQPTALHGTGTALYSAPGRGGVFLPDHGGPRSAAYRPPGFLPADPAAHPGRGMQAITRIPGSRSAVGAAVRTAGAPRHGGGPAPPERGGGPPPGRRAWSDRGERVAGASGDQRAEGDGADAAVRVDAGLLLERVHGLLGLRPEDAVRVGGGPGLVAVGLQGLLHGPDLVPLVALLGQAEAGAQRGPGLGVEPARVRDVALALVLLQGLLQLAVEVGSVAAGVVAVGAQQIPGEGHLPGAVALLVLRPGAGLHFGLHPGRRVRAVGQGRRG